MRKMLLALSAVLVLSSFTNNTNEKIVLKDIEGTLLQSFPIIKHQNGEYTITFTVDASTVVTSNIDNDNTHIHLIANGSSNTLATHTIVLNTKNVDFNHYFEGNADVASLDGMSKSTSVRTRPRGQVLE